MNLTLSYDMVSFHAGLGHILSFRCVYERVIEGEAALMRTGRGGFRRVGKVGPLRLSRMWRSRRGLWQIFMVKALDQHFDSIAIEKFILIFIFMFIDARVGRVQAPSFVIICLVGALSFVDIH